MKPSLVIAAPNSSARGCALLQSNCVFRGANSSTSPDSTPAPATFPTVVSLW